MSHERVHLAERGHYHAETYDYLAKRDDGGTWPFCEIVGPERVFDDVEPWVACHLAFSGEASPADAGDIAATSSRFVSWLGRRAWIPPDRAGEEAARLREAAAILPRAQGAWEILCRPSPAGLDRRPSESVVAGGLFRVVRIRPGQVWLEWDMERGTRGPFVVPRAATDVMEEGWVLTAAVARVGAREELYDVWGMSSLEWGWMG